MDTLLHFLREDVRQNRKISLIRKGQTMKKKRLKNSIKIMNFPHQEDYEKMKRQVTNWERVFATHKLTNN